MTSDERTRLCGLHWNPEFAVDLLGVCTTDGAAALYSVKAETPCVFELVGRLLASTDRTIRSLCWSPKGKQFVIALKNSLEQYDTKLQKKRVIKLQSVIAPFMKKGK